MHDREAIAQACRNSLFVFCHAICGYQDVDPVTHEEPIRILESPSQRKLIVLPRGSLKSSIGSVAYPLWCLVRDPNDTILLDSELYTNSVSRLREIKGHIESDKFRYLFGDWKTKVWNEGELIIRPRTKVAREASITIGGIGTTKVGQHYKKIVGDDYNSPNNTNTPEKARKVVDHFKYNLSILEPDGTYVIIGTRYGAADIIGHVLKQQEEKGLLSHA